MGKKKNKRGPKAKFDKELKQHILEGVLQYQQYSLSDSRTLNRVKLTPKSWNQEQYLKKLKNNKKKIVLAIGPAGTGKSLFASQVGIDMFMRGKYERIIITRPVMTVDEDIGFLPGSLEDKMAPWMSPIYDIFGEYFYQSEIKAMIEEKTIEVCPLAFMRGRTFKKCWIIADEMQNATKNQLKMLLTRIGEKSKLVVTGDLEQNDRKDGDEGLADFLYRVKKNKSKLITYQEFEISDIERCEVVKEVLDLYDDDKKTDNENLETNEILIVEHTENIELKEIKSNEKVILENMMFIQKND